MTTALRAVWLLCAAAAAGTAPAAETPTATSSADATRPLSLEVGMGVQRDSNVAILDLDTSAGAGDTAGLFEFGAGYDKPAAGRFDWQAGYAFTQSLHGEFDAFDLAIHRASATTTYDLDRVDVGANFTYALAELDGDEFMTFVQASPYASKLVGRRLFLRFAYAHTDKDFAGNPLRDAAADSLSADVYVFVNGLATYLAFGYRYDDENALDAQFDYAGRKLSAQLSKRMPLAGRDVTLKGYLRYETRDYASVTPTIGAERRDDRYQFEASAERPLGARWVGRIGYKLGDNRSNLPSVDFDENVFLLSFTATL